MGKKKISQKADDYATQFQAGEINIYLNSNSENTKVSNNIVDRANEIMQKLEYNKSMTPFNLDGDENLNTTAVMYLEEKGYVSVIHNSSTNYNPIITFSLTKAGLIYKESLNSE